MTDIGGDRREEAVDRRLPQRGDSGVAGTSGG